MRYNVNVSVYHAYTRVDELVRGGMTLCLEFETEEENYVYKI